MSIIAILFNLIPIVALVITVVKFLQKVKDNNDDLRGYLKTSEGDYLGSLSIMLWIISFMSLVVIFSQIKNIVTYIVN